MHSTAEAAIGNSISEVNVIISGLSTSFEGWSHERKGKGKGLDTCYSATYMSQTSDQQRFTI